MKHVSAPKFALSEAAGETIRSTVWVALILALVGVSFDGEGEFRWKSLLPGGHEATVAIAEIQAPPALPGNPESAAAVPVAEEAQPGAVPESAFATEPESLALASSSCQGDAGPLGLCADDISGREQSGLPGAPRDRPNATVNAAR